MQAELIVDARNAVGESPVWVPQENALYWVDIPNGGLQRWSADTGHVASWKAPEMLACIGRSPDGGWVAGMEIGFFRLHTHYDGSLDSESLAHVDHSVPDSGAVDLLIRTGGEQRLSDFLLWDCAYAELYFTDRLWPDFGEVELRAALADYSRRQRRFGKVLAAAETG